MDEPARRVVEGPVAPFEMLTVDRRRLELGSLSVSRIGDYRFVELDDGPVEVVLPLLGLEAPGADHAGSRLIGRITRVWVDDDRWVHIKGTCILEVPPGRYGCGMDLTHVTMRLSWADAPDAVITEDELRNDTHRQLVQNVTKARLAAVTLYLPGSTASPAFSDAGVLVR